VAGWAEHREGCTGERARLRGKAGDWLSAPEPTIGADEVEEAPARPKAKGAPHAGAGKAPGADDEEPLCAYRSCPIPRIGVCTRCRAMGWCSTEHQKAHWKAGHKAVCAPAETRLVPVLSWEQRVMAEARAAAPASLAATAKLAPIPDWNITRNGAPPTATLKAWRKAAEVGHAGAQLSLGFCHEQGKGVLQDFKLAAEWYAKAAAQGHAGAQSSLGFCYELGEGVSQDYKLAAEWYAKAAAQGHAAAQCALGLCYQHGKGVSQDYKLAAEWYAKAAAQGVAAAQCNLGVCYEHGKGVAQDYKIAVEWYAKSAAQGHAGALRNLGVCYELGKVVAQDLKLAAEWYAKAAAQGCADASARRAACLARIAALGAH